VILVSLKDGHLPTADYVRKLRQALPAAFPEDIFYFQAADMVAQILNFGVTAQIDVRTVGYDRIKNLQQKGQADLTACTAGVDELGNRDAISRFLRNPAA
jgi:hypothetical protein